jgi:hypothetical protein
MSRKYVRDTVRPWLTELATPFVESINAEENPTTDIWLTVEFMHETTETTSICGNQEERGVIDLIFSGNPGIGDADVISAADIDTKAFMKKIDPTGQLVLLNDLAPEEFSGGSASRYYQVVVGIEYLYKFNVQV